MDIDLLRIKIWDAAMDEMIYDSKLGIGDGDDQGIALGGGAIRIHKANWIGNHGSTRKKP